MLSGLQEWWAENITNDKEKREIHKRAVRNIAIFIGMSISPPFTHTALITPSQ